jgi:hypothetical protein
MTKSRLICCIGTAAITATLLSFGAEADTEGAIKTIAPASLFCVQSDHATGGFKGPTIPIANVLYQAQKTEGDFVPPDFYSAFGSRGGKGQPSTSAALEMLMQAYFHDNGDAHSKLLDNPEAEAPPPETPQELGEAFSDPDGDKDKDVLANTGLQDANRLAAKVYGLTRRYLADVVFDKNNAEIFAIDPNGAPLGTADWEHIGTGDPAAKPMTRADWLLWQLAAGETYQIGCANVIAKKTGGGLLPAAASPPVKDVPATDYHLNSLFKTSSYHVSGERDDLALSSFALSDPLGSSPSFTVQPGSSHSGKGSGNTYNFTAQGAAGYTVWEANCNYGKMPTPTCTTPQSLTLFADAFYGQDKNAPKSPGSTSQIVDRVGSGLDYALRWDPGFGYDTDTIWSKTAAAQHRWAALVQFIPEFVTDTHFEAKTFYGEARLDLIDAPGLLCTGNSTFAMPLIGVQVNCGLAAIADYADNFKAERAMSLHNDFQRLGGEIGLGFAPDPGMCDSTACELITDKLSASVWYKLLADTSSNHASVHNFTAQMSYNISGGSNSSGGKGLALTLQYTDGREDITLFKLPTWSVGFKGSL